MLKKTYGIIAAVVLCVLAAAFPQLEVSAEASSDDVIGFSVETYNCSGGENNGKITVVLDNVSDNDVYSVSFNSGKNFYEIPEKTFSLFSAKPGSYAVCVMKNNDMNTLSKIHTVYVGNDEEKFPISIHTESTGENIYKDGKIRIFIENYESGKAYECTVNGGKTWKDMTKRAAVITSVKGGKHKVAVREKDKTENSSPTMIVRVPEIQTADKKYIKVEKFTSCPNCRQAVKSHL